MDNFKLWKEVRKLKITSSFGGKYENTDQGDKTKKWKYILSVNTKMK